jgi:hypothetical protein
MIYVYAWGPRFRVPGLAVLDRKGQRCKLLVRGRMNSALVEFPDGVRHVISRSALRKPKPATIREDAGDWTALQVI